MNNDFRWLNQSQPQTLYGATLLLYINAVFGLLSLGATGPLGVLFTVGMAAAGLGIANEKRWGYTVGVVIAVLRVAILVLVFGFGVVTDFALLLDFMFDALLVGLLLHPMSRDYQRIWFH